MADEIKQPQDGGTPGASGPAQTGPAPKPSDEEVKNAKLKEENERLAAQQAEILKAKAEAEAELQRVREAKRQAKKDPAPSPAPEAGEEKLIDESDPDAKAWIKKIQTTVSPVAEELEKQRAELRGIALEEFLEEHPATAKSPEKLKEMMSLYDKLSTGQTKEGIKRDLEMAYAAAYRNELLKADRQARIDKARKDALFSDIAVSRGSTDYSAPKDEKREYSEDEKAILARWSQSPAFPKIEE